MTHFQDGWRSMVWRKTWHAADNDTRRGKGRRFLIAAAAMLAQAAVLAAISGGTIFGPAMADEGVVAVGSEDVAADHAGDADGLAEIDPRVEEAETRRIAAVERAMPATVAIFDAAGAGGGSGVLISADGYALTYFHVISTARDHVLCGLPDGRVYDGVLIGIDPVGDLALIRLLGRDDFPFAEMADSRKVQVGNWCMAIGNPFLLATNLKPTVTWGIVSGVARYQYPAGTLLEYGDCLQTDASINPGNSGGPLFDDSGRLIGIIGRGSFEKRGRVNVGVGYAISINQAKNFLGDLHSGRILDHATLGATVSTDPDGGGARVSNILDSSDAYRRGLRYGHTIVEIDGRSVNTANEVQNVLATLPAQWRVPLVFLDRGVRKSTLVRLANLHGYDELLVKMSQSMPPPPPVPGPPPQSPAPGQPAPDDSEPGAEADPAGEGEGGEEGDKQQPGEGGRKRGPRSPGRPNPHGGTDAGGTQTPVPPEVAAIFEARRGFANYYPNRVKQQQLHAALRGQFPGMLMADGIDSAAIGGTAAGTGAAVWRIEGTTDDDQARKVSILVTDDDYTLVVGDQTISATRRSELYAGVASANVSGMLAGLDSWRTLLINGPDRFGECFYRGMVPYLGARPLRDCLVGVAGELESRWLMDAQTGRLEAVEVMADRDDDPAELHIRWGDEPAAPPTHLDLRYGTTSVLAVKIDSWRIEPKGDAQQ